MYIKVYGYDYSSIKADLIECDDKSIAKSTLLKIVIKYLDSISKNVKDLIKDSRTNNKGIKIEKIYKKIGKDSFRFNGYVGIISDKIKKISERELDSKTTSNKEYSDIDIKIIIQSRFDVNSNDKPGKPFFLITMLLLSDARFDDHLIPYDSDKFIYDLMLLYAFKTKCKKAYEKGLYKQYQSFERNDDKIKGSIDFARHIKLNLGLNNGVLAYTYKEYSIDNNLNHLILAAFNTLYRKYPELLLDVLNNNNEYDFKKIITDLQNQLSKTKYDNASLVNKNLTPISHPYFYEYEELRKLCLKIVLDDDINVSNESQDSFNAIIYYIPDLWENYVEMKLINNYDCKSQLPIRIFDFNGQKDYVQETRPDYVFFKDSNNKKPYFVLDAKFKKCWGSLLLTKRFSNSNDEDNDLLEDYNKCIRDMNTYNLHRVGVIFPTNDLIISKNFLNTYQHNISKFNTIDKFYTFPIYIPKADNNLSYNSWNQDFKRNNINIINTFNAELENFKKLH